MCIRDSRNAVRDQPVAHHVALRARLVAALRAADDHQPRLLPVFLQRRRQPPFKRDGGRAVRLDLLAEHDDGVKFADRGQMGLLVICLLYTSGKRPKEKYHSYKGDVGKVADNIINRDFSCLLYTSGMQKTLYDIRKD